ncbi:MAG: hypothetical protein JOY62_04915 [Acidobacteriaceae bacterium]|nr:hypothetical protein [Acidobacteriaceae bacterium]MBV9779296.1 hypothetical protein [Acidobacteriaceae bacterium]
MKAEPAAFECLKDLKQMLASPGPCLSVYMPLSVLPANQAVKQNALQWKQCLHTLEEKVRQNGSEARRLLDSVADWRAISSDHKKGNAIAVFRSQETFCVTSLNEPVQCKAVIGPHFFVRPLLPELTRDKTFYILALSQKDVRMLRCTSSDSEEVRLPQHVATSFDAFMNTAKPDHVRDNRASPGPGVGSSKGVMFTTSSDREDKDEYLAHFYRQIDRGVNEILRGKGEPVVPVGVEYELALYRTVNTYSRLAEGVHGAPNSLKSGEMHARALDAMLREYERKVDEALAEYNHRVGGGASNRLKDIVPAAHDGRVLTLLVSDSLETTGSFDEATHTVKGRESGNSEDEDLVNDAVVQTILHAGQVFVVPNGKMPNGAPLSATFRF